MEVERGGSVGVGDVNSDKVGDELLLSISASGLDFDCKDGGGPLVGPRLLLPGKGPRRRDGAIVGTRFQVLAICDRSREKC
jgi:hypothetical protein